MQHFTSRDPFDFTVPAECTGESVSFVGEVPGSVSIVSAPSGDQDHVTVHGLIRATGTGLTTGARYVFRDVLHTNFNSSNTGAPHSTSVSRDAVRVIRQGSLDNLVVTFDLVVVFTGQGLEKLQFERLGTRCLGEDSSV